MHPRIAPFIIQSYQHTCSAGNPIHEVGIYNAKTELAEFFGVFGIVFEFFDALNLGANMIVPVKTLTGGIILW